MFLQPKFFSLVKLKKLGFTSPLINHGQFCKDRIKYFWQIIWQTLDHNWNLASDSAESTVVILNQFFTDLLWAMES